nr:reverse transcriptase domain-containing protein [Tanacetum cinerariifolium]
MTWLTNSNLELKNMFGQFMKMNTASSLGSEILPSNNITNLKEDLKGITTRSGIAYQGPTIHTTSSPPKVVECETEVTKDTVPPTNNGNKPQTSNLRLSKLKLKYQILSPLLLPLLSQLLLLLVFRSSLTLIGRALIDVYEGELTLRVGKEAVTCNLDQTSRYSSNYDAMSVNRIDLIDIACEEYSQEVLTFSMSGNPTPSMEPIISVSSPTFTPFEDSDFLLEETDAFLLIDDESISLEIDDCYYDSDGDMLLLEEFLNDDPSAPPLPPQELKVVEPNNEKAFIDEPPVVEFKDLPPHLEYAFLEGDDKLPVMIAKDLKDEGKTTLKKSLWTTSRSLRIHSKLASPIWIKMLKRCEDTNLCLNWEKSHFMVKDGIVLGHKISKNEIEVDKAKVDVIAKLPQPTTVKGIRSVLGHAGFYR